NPDGLGIPDIDLAQLQQTLQAAREANAADPLEQSMREDLSDEVESYLQQFTDAQLAAENEAMAAAETAAAPIVDNSMTDRATVTEPVVTQVGDSNSGLFSNPLLLGIGVFGLLFGIGLIVFVIRHIRAVDDRPVERATPVVPSEPADPIQQAESDLRDDPDSLDSHLHLLQLLAGADDADRFGAALDSMYARVDHDEVPQWLEALKLAQLAAPDHPLVHASTDWVAVGSADDEHDASAEDPESKMDDLMSRILPADEDPSEAADADAVALELDERRLDERGQDQHGTGDSGATEDDMHTLENDPIQDDSIAFEARELIEDEPADQPAANEQSEALNLDWPEGGEGDALAARQGTEQPNPTSDPVDDEADDALPADLFRTASDDDMDVKLDLARAYLSWNSVDSARTLIEEVMREGNARQQEQARQLLEDLG
ncbi:MAG: FimV/HubP family polar landmark protein, partial [Pseudomonadota bacterium]